MTEKREKLDVNFCKECGDMPCASCSDVMEANHTEYQEYNYD